MNSDQPWDEFSLSHCGFMNPGGNSSLKGWIHQVKVWVHKVCLRIHCRKKGIHSYPMNSQSLSNEATPSCCESIIKSEFTHSGREFPMNSCKITTNSLRRGGIHWSLHEFVVPSNEFSMAAREFIATPTNSSSSTWIPAQPSRIQQARREFTFDSMNSPCFPKNSAWLQVNSLLHWWIHLPAHEFLWPQDEFPPSHHEFINYFLPL